MNTGRASPAGPTGVELAGALAEIAGRTLAHDFRAFDPRKTRVILVEAGPRVVPSFPERLSARARADLEALGVEVRAGTPVADLGEDFVEIGNDYIATRTILSAAGVRASEPAHAPFQTRPPLSAAFIERGRDRHAASAELTLRNVSFDACGNA